MCRRGGRREKQCRRPSFPPPMTPMPPPSFNLRRVHSCICSSQHPTTPPCPLFYPDSSNSTITLLLPRLRRLHPPNRLRLPPMSDALLRGFKDKLKFSYWLGLGPDLIFLSNQFKEKLKFSYWLGPIFVSETPLGRWMGEGVSFLGRRPRCSNISYENVSMLDP